MTKQDEIDKPDSTLNRAAPDEPIFILRAQDSVASDTIRDWARRAAEAGAPGEKVDEALDLATQMDRWPSRKTPD